MVAVEDAIINTGLVLLGFLIAVGWDRIQGRRADSENRNRIFDLINVEATNNVTTSNQILSAHAAGQLQGVVTIPSLHDSGWDTAASNWSLLKLSTDETIELNNTYRTISAVNRAIWARDTYSITAVAMSNYAQSLAALNTMLTNAVQQFLSAHGRLQPLLANRLEKRGVLKKLRIRRKRK